LNRQINAPDAEQTYRARRRRRRWLWVAGLAAVAVLVLVTARRPDLSDPCDPPSAAPASELALMPAGLSFDRIGTVTEVEEDGIHVNLQAVTTKPVDEVTILIQDAVTAAGYRFAGMDSEGSEAEVFFTSGAQAGGQARIEPAACQGRWDIDLVLLQRDA
jgi:hypothetical protein